MNVTGFGMPDNNLKRFSNYIVYVDESGDHGLVSIDSEYPVFVLVFCIFQKQEYTERIISDLAKFKMRFWGHSEVVLHEHDIRKPKDEFKILFNKSVRNAFIKELHALMNSTHFTIIASVIDKKKLMSQYYRPVNPYEISLSFGLERVFRYLDDIGQSESRTPIIVERRGKKEDEGLELTFRRICDGANILNKTFPYDLIMIDKKANSAGLQIADLTARPIGIKTLRPNQPNRAYGVIMNKFRKSPTGDVRGWGLKIFP
ncbi:MAG: DUF3800 domain-containing protein [Planctomycetota bacterium]